MTFPSLQVCFSQVLKLWRSLLYVHCNYKKAKVRIAIGSVCWNDRQISIRYRKKTKSKERICNTEERLKTETEQKKKPTVFAVKPDFRRTWQDGYWLVKITVIKEVSPQPHQCWLLQFSGSKGICCSRHIKTWPRGEASTDTCVPKYFSNWSCHSVKLSLGSLALGSQVFLKT